MSETVSSPGESYAEDTPLVELFGNSARPRILSVFATKRNREFSISELSRQAGVARNTVYDNIDHLEEIGAVESVEGGQGNRYTAAETKVATKLYELSGVTLKRLFEIEESE